LSLLHFTCLLVQVLCHAPTTGALLIHHHPSYGKKNGLSFSSFNNNNKSVLSSSSSWTRSSPSSSITTSNTIMNKIRGGASSPLSMSSGDALRLARTLAPKIGILSSTALYFAPAAAVLSAIQKDSLDDLNPLPIAIMSIVSVSWLAYGLMSNDIYLASSNFAGCIASIGYVVGVLPLLGKGTNQKQLRTTQGVLLAGVSVVLSLWTYLGVSGTSVARMSQILGMFASAIFIILAGSPLSTISTVIATKDSRSILGTLTAAQVINTVLWGVYGLAIKDRFVYGPNLIGLVLGLIQLGLKLMFPAKKEEK